MVLLRFCGTSGAGQQSNLLARIVWAFAGSESIARVIEVDHLLQALQVSIVHVSFHEVRMGPLIGIPQGCRLEFSVEGIGMLPPVCIDIIRASQKVADSFIDEAITSRIGDVTILIGLVL